MIDGDAAVLQYTDAISKRNTFRQRPTGCSLCCIHGFACSALLNRSPSRSRPKSQSSLALSPSRLSAVFTSLVNTYRTLPEPDKLLQRALPHIALVVLLVAVRIALAVIIIVAVVSLASVARVIAVR
jgi:hypothetical protein